MTFLSRYSHWLAALFAVAYLGSHALPARQPAGKPDLQAFGTVPVVDGGRVKPLDTVARTYLMVISAGKQTYKDVPYRTSGGNTLPAMHWLMEAWSNLTPFEGPATKHQVIRVENDQLLNLLDLELRPEFYRYSPAEIEKRYGRFEAEYNRVRKIEPKARDPYEQMVFEVGRRLHLYESLVRRQKPLVVPPPRSDAEDWRSLAEVDATAAGPAADQLRTQIVEALKTKLEQQKIDLDRLSPEAQAELLSMFMREYTRRLEELVAPKRAEISPAAAAFDKILALYKAGDADGFNRAVADYKATHLAHLDAGELRAVRFEAFFNRFDPFHHCLVLYVAAFALGCLSWAFSPVPLRRAALALAAVALAAHTFALIGRMYIQGRPPVTNLYSSAVFIGWGAVLVGLALEAIYRNGVGTVLAGLLGFLSLLIADNLGATGDTLEMMQAVLDTNFWLATHVTIVTLGYVATYVAGFVGIIYILRGVFTPTLTPAESKETSQMIYGVVCFATLLSFVGTVLGGIWADQSWGRFWGWDPKENGAILIVIWNALVLHARWGGLVKPRGVAVLAVLGNVVTTWSWFGTNQLGVGLHAYGFRNDIAFWVVVSSLVFLGIAGIGALVPQRAWQSFSPAAPAAKAKPRGGKRGTAEAVAS